MDVRTLVVPAAVGAAVAVAVGAGATELLRSVVWPSLIVGIPVGVLAGMAAFVAVLFSMTDD